MGASEAAASKELRVVFTDISELVRLDEERRLEAERFQAKKLKAIETLSAGVAHNINNMLAVIMATNTTHQMLAQSAEDLKTCQIIESACKRGRDVVKSLVLFSRPFLSEAGPMDLHTLISEVHILLECNNQNHIKIVEALFPEPLWVHGSAGTLSSAIMNIALNAMDAMDEVPEGGTLTIRTSVPEEGWIHVSVEDNGKGMTPEVLEQVMEPFFTTKSPGKGTGLGLSMVSGVINAHGGSMEISSQPTLGTVVALRLPRSPVPIQPPVDQPQTPPPGPLSILLVDDDEDVRDLTRIMFKVGGLDANCAEGGKEALEYLRTHALPDLVILDQNMPGMDGVETMEAIRKLHIDLPILISSGRLDILDWECFKRPHVAILPKPFDVAELKDKLNKMGFKPKDRS